MSRNFEQEYKELMMSKTPDLWDKIEAGVAASPRTNSVIEMPTTVKSVDTAKKSNIISFTKRNKYQLVALAGVAACLAVFAINSSSVKQDEPVAEAEMVVAAVSDVVEVTKEPSVEDVVETVPATTEEIKEEPVETQTVETIEKEVEEVVKEPVVEEQPVKQESAPAKAEPAVPQLTPEQQAYLAAVAAQQAMQQAQPPVAAPQTPAAPPVDVVEDTNNSNHSKKPINPDNVGVADAEDEEDEDEEEENSSDSTDKIESVDSVEVE